MSGERPWITTMLNYDGGDVAKLKINVEGAKEEEMRAKSKLQAAITEAKDLAKRHCMRDGVTTEMQVTIAYHEAETSTDTVDREHTHLDKDSGAESKMSEAETRSWHGLEHWRRDHPRTDPVESGPEADSLRRANRQQDIAHVGFTRKRDWAVYARAARLQKERARYEEHRSQLIKRAAMARSNDLFGYRPRHLRFYWSWEPMSEEGATVDACLSYSKSDMMDKLKINVYGGKEQEMRKNVKVQGVITEARDRAEPRFRRDGVIASLKVMVTYHEEETSTSTTEREQQELDHDSEAESEASDAQTRSFHGLE
ncbi:hypothetical protein CBR_g37186 [Chara braunii]|uniref:Uncharacterized protein n=1 Tax=Chara braunii TaxID=69332 RepID=A0A388LMF7_CHABU|nr:hypothetical protein CBR_g37186 [Chara braunii]|eukprot:GBG83474.1 hypothetical protein CBR_g37186 [Chara braunii]